jgi:hypothetical protein
MRSTPVLLAMAVVAGAAACGSDGADVVVSGSAPEQVYDGPMHVATSHADDATVEERTGAAGRALECDTAPYTGGPAEYDIGLASVQESAEEALSNYFAEEYPLPAPQQGYRVERADDGRVLFSFDVAQRSKVVFIAADGVVDFDGDRGWGIETWAECDPSELPAEVTEALGIQVWHDAAGNRVPVTVVRSSQGPEHCDWQDITFLSLGKEDAGEQYLRDTRGELARWLTTTYDDQAVLPGDATDTGYHRDGRHLWIAADRRAAYLVGESDPSDVERWPAVRERIGCQ